MICSFVVTNNFSTNYKILLQNTRVNKPVKADTRKKVKEEQLTEYEHTIEYHDLLA